nr:siphovirus Gp157 family protein [Chromatium okenii]
MSITLYQIADDYRDILSLMESDYDDPELRQLVQDTLDQLQLDDQFTDKALAVACYTRELELEAEAVKATENLFVAANNLNHVLSSCGII